MAFNAGAIEARLTLDRTAFSAGLKAARAEAEKWAKNGIDVKINPKLDRTALATVKAQIERVTGNVSVKVKLDNTSLQAVKARINRTVGNINVRVKLDNASLTAIRARINRTVGNIRVRLDLDNASLQSIRARVNSVRLSIKVRLDFDRSDLARLRAELALFRPVIKVRLDIDRSSLSQLNGLIGRAGSGFSGVHGQLRQVIAALPLLLSVGAPAITGLIGLLGGLVSILGIVTAGLGAFGLVGAKVFSTINQNAQKTKDAIKGISSAYDQVASARERLTQVVEQSAAQNAAAERRVADAREQLSRTVESAARADVAAEERVADAQKNVAKAVQSAARDNVAAQERIADAREALSETIQSAARADADAEERVADAREALSEAVEAAARADVAAEERVTEARKDLARTIEDVAQANASAQRQVENAERSLTRTQEAAQRAQEDLNQARKDAIEDLEDLKLSLRGAALSEEQAVIDLAEAQKDYNQALHEGTTGTELKQLELNIRKAKLSLDESRESYGDLKEKSAEYAKTGIEGSEGVRNAQEKLAEANQDIKDSERDVAEARAEAAQTALDGQRKIQESQDAIIKAQKEATQTHLDGQKDILKAQKNVSEAQQDAVQTALDGQKSIQKAQEAVSKAQQEAAQTALDGQERILEAQQEAARAQKEATQTALDGQRDIADAQKAVADAQQEAARVALENQRQIASATRELAEAQRAYNEALGEMPKKLLPGMQLAEDALNRLKASYQDLVERTSPATGRAFAAMFDAATAAINTLDPLINATSASLERMGRNLQTYFGTKDWKDFVDFLSQHVGPTLDKVFAAAGQLMGGIKGLVVAFQPLADWILDKIVAGLTEFNIWANNLANDPAFQAWLEDVKVDLSLLWQFLVKVVEFFAKLVKEIEPFGRPVMQGLIAALDFLNKLPPGMLGTIAMGLTAIATALILGAGGPVALGIGALVAAGTALAYLAKTSPEAQAAMDGFVNWLKTIWQPIWDTIQKNFEEKIKPAFDRLVAVVRDDLWPALQRFGAVIAEEVIPKLQPLFDTITGKLIPALIDFLAKLAPIVSYMLDTWGPVIADVLGRTLTVFDGTLTAIAGVVQTVTGLISGDWKTFGEGLHTIAEGFWTIIAGLFGTNLDGLKQKFDEADAWIKRVWGDLGTWMSGIGSDFINTVQQRFSEFGPWVSQRVQEAADGIGRAWRAVANFFREPINWVINVVMNDGILGAWNQVMGWIGQPALSAAPIAQIPAFATGGLVSGPGTGTSDSILARVSTGEYIVPASVAQANMGLLASLPRFQAGGEIATGSAGATVAPGTTATAQSETWWDRVGANATALFNSLRNFTGMPSLGSLIGNAITNIPSALIDRSLESLKTKLSAMLTMPPAAPGATALDPYGNDPRQSAVFDKGGILRPRTNPINTSKYAERVLSPKQTQDFNELIKILNEMFHPTKTKAPGGGDVYHITLPKGATVRELANEINFRKKVSAKGRYSPR